MNKNTYTIMFSQLLEELEFSLKKQDDLFVLYDEMQGCTAYWDNYIDCIQTPKSIIEAVSTQLYEIIIKPLICRIEDYCSQNEIAIPEGLPFCEDMEDIAFLLCENNIAVPILGKPENDGDEYGNLSFVNLVVNHLDDVDLSELEKLGMVEPLKENGEEYGREMESGTGITF